MNKVTLPRSKRIFIRREKARIRRGALSPEEQDKLIKALLPQPR
jgi:hypothetical protein